MRTFDDQERAILKALIRDPRQSDNYISKITSVPTPTVRRKRKRLEEEGLINYFVAIDMQETGAGTFGARHLYIIRFRIGVTVKQIVDEIKSEPNVRSVFTDLIYESHIAELDGRVALVMIIEGKNDADIIENVQGKDHTLVAQEPRPRVHRGDFHPAPAQPDPCFPQLCAAGEHAPGCPARRLVG